MATHSSTPRKRAKVAIRFATAIVIVLLTIWGTLAIYWSNLQWFPLRLALAVAFAAGGLITLFLMLHVRMRHRALAAFGIAFLIILSWWITIQPSHNRDWQPQVSVMPTAAIDGDVVRLSGFRSFDYRSNNDYTVRYEERAVSLSELESVDLFLSYWSPSGFAAHTFVCFNFRNAPSVCISIEARLEKGETYSALGSCFKQHELIYVVGSERDIVGVRLHHRNEEVYRYRIQASQMAVERLFRAYLDEINRLAKEPQWYHLLRNNCTSNIARKAQSQVRRAPFDLRLLFNAYADRFAYDHGLLDTSLPFDDLRREARIVPATEGEGR